MGTRQRKKDKSGKSVPEVVSEELSTQSERASDAAADAMGISKTSPYRKFFTRVLTGAILIGVFTGVILSDHVIIGIFVMLLQMVVFKELVKVRYNSVKEKKILWFRTLNWYLLVVTFFLLYGKTVLLHMPIFSSFFLKVTNYHLLISFMAYTAGFVFFILTLQQGLYKFQITQLTWTIMTLVTVVLPSSCIIKNTFEGIFWFFLPCSIVVVNDIFAYFCGFFAGKKFISRPFLTISPNKTWEGFIGATFWTLLFAFYASGYFAQHQWLVCPRVEFDLFSRLECTPNPVFLPHKYYLPQYLAKFASDKLSSDLSYIELRPIQLHSLSLALFGSLIAPFGGFFASAIKRAYKIKDFDNVFPGHGGFTDRTDCQYIMGLFTFVYYTVFIKALHLGVESILDLALQLSAHEQQVVINRLTESVAILNSTGTYF